MRLFSRLPLRSRPDQQPLSSPPRPPHRRSVSSHTDPGLSDLGRGHRRGRFGIAVKVSQPKPRVSFRPQLHKLTVPRRHRIPKQRHRVTNWAAYDAGLRARGSLTVWFTPEAIEAWRAEPRTGRGGQPRYSSLAITTALTLRTVFRLALRQTEGLIGSVLQLLGLDLPVPDHSTLSRRAETLEERADAPAGGRHGAEALRPGRVAGGEARHQAAPGLESAASRDGRRHRPDRR